MTWRLLLLAVPLSLLVGCDPEQAAAADGILGGLEGLATGGAAAGIPGLVALVGVIKVARKATAAMAATSGPSRAEPKVAELERMAAALERQLAEERVARVALEREVERMQTLLMARGIGTLPAEPVRAGAAP